ncbi:hypothetical protein HDU99_003584 [Rhizoclosmatium hyalinum]|nr:hypothetical protein HDU99_003584 [Rhizoclosmatium hyalinum]
MLTNTSDLALLLFSAAATTAAVRLSLVPFVAPVTVSSTDTHSLSDNESDFEVVSSAAPHSDIDDNDDDDEHAKLVASVLIRGDDEKSDSEESTNENENENELEAASNVESVEAIYEDMDNGDPLSPIHENNRVEVGVLPFFHIIHQLRHPFLSSTNKTNTSHSLN